MRRIRMVIEYDGTGYVGWQTQKNGPSVQARLEEELYTVTGARSVLHGSGRTDSGVHARAQVAHFDTDVRMPADKFAYALNAGLPGDIRVRHSQEVPPSFHARFDATRKHYRYSLYLGPHSRVFYRHTALHVHGAPDMALLSRAASDICGRHDFRAFMSAGIDMENTVREVYHSAWTARGDMLHYDIAGNGFLYNMVRILVGTMLEIAVQKRPPGAIADAMRARARTAAGPTAPPHGLCLMRVCYDGFDTDDV